MKVAMIDPSLFTLPYDLALLRALAAEGHTVELYGRDLVGSESIPERSTLRPLFYPELRKLPVERWPAPLVRALKGVLHLRAMRRLVRQLRADRPDIIHFQWLPLPVVDRRFLEPLRRIAPLVITAHDSQPFNANPGSALQSIGAVDVLRQFDRVIVHTEQGRQRLVAAGLEERRLAQIPHGFLHDEAARDVPPPRPRAETDPIRFLLFGKIKPYKGVDLLIEAVARLPEATRRRCQILVIGKPYMDTQPLLQLAEQRGVRAQFDFQFRFVEEDELGQLFTASDVMLFPYREIEVSGVLMAVLRTQRPIVASRIGGFAELLEDGRHGLLVPPGDIDALSAALGRIVETPQLRATIAAELGRLVDSIPDWDGIARRTHDVYAAAHAH